MAKKVAIIMGSKSDLPIVEKGVKVLKQYGIPYVLTITSAHRALKNTVKVVEKYQEAGIEIFIVCAGASAHLAGVVSALVTQPVIGVPIGSSIFKGIDSLFSIVQMPKGIPVATVGVNAVENAALLAVQILSLKEGRLKTMLKQHKKNLAKKIFADNRSIRRK